MFSKERMNGGLLCHISKQKSKYLSITKEKSRYMPELADVDHFNNGLSNESGGIILKWLSRK